RRQFFGRSAVGIGTAALAALLDRDLSAATRGGLPGLPHFAPKAKRVIYLFQNGAPSHVDLFDYKPQLADWRGKQIPPEVQGGRSRLGAWLTYGLGSDTQDLPAFVVLTSRDKEASCGQIFYDFYWGSGFLPTKFQGVQFRGSGDPVLYLSNPAGMSRQVRRAMLDDLAKMNELTLREFGDPEIATRIAQYEMAYR